MWTHFEACISRLIYKEHKKIITATRGEYTPPYPRQRAGNPPSKHPGCLSTGPPPWLDLHALGPATGHSRTIWLSYTVFSVECNVCYCPRIKLKCPYHNYYSSSFYQFWQLELLICTSTLVFKHFLYTIMPYISNAKIGCNFITPYFQHTQLQHFCPEIPQQRAGYSTS